MDNWAVRDTLTGAVYPQPNKLIAEKVAEMHGHSEVIRHGDLQSAVRAIETAIEFETRDEQGTAASFAKGAIQFLEKYVKEHNW